MTPSDKLHRRDLFERRVRERRGYGVSPLLPVVIVVLLLALLVFLLVSRKETGVSHPQSATQDDISAATQLASQNDRTGHLVEVGPDKMFLNCTGNARGTTVILEAGTGDSSEVWNAVQKQVEQFAHVCSYDRLGLGKSDKLTVAHTADEIVDDLHQLLQSAHVPPPYFMVGHSIGGIYVRKYAAIYPTEVTGLVLLDSAHEEQFSRVSEISPEWAKRISDRFPADEQRAQGFLPRMGVWHGISMGHSS